MASYKKYYGKNVGVRYFPDQNVIYLEPKKGLSKTDLRQYKEKLEIYLNIQSSNFVKNNGKPAFSIKLSDQSQQPQVEELLRQMFHGGDEVMTAADLSDDEDNEEEQQNQPPDMNQQMMQQQQMQQPGMPQMPQESVGFLDAVTILAESTYRTADYWDVLARASGKGKQAIDDKAVLSLRRTYTQKPRGKRRNEVLRSLDSAMKYFARKIRKQMGDGAALQFKERYRAIGDLVPSDYKDTEQGDHFKVGRGAKTAFTTVDKSSQNKQKNTEDREDPEKLNMDFSNFFSDQEEEDEEDAYERFETEE